MVAPEVIDFQQTEIDDPTRWHLLQRKATELRIQKAFQLFRTNGIEPILIKGFAAAQFFPASAHREYIDMDLAVAQGDFDSASRLVTSSAANGLAIDLHRELRHLDTVDWDNLMANSRLIELQDQTVRVLRPEDHLRVLCVHWLTDGGANQYRLWDIYYAIENRSADFDWDRFLNIVDDRRRRWLVCAVGLAKRFLGLDLANTPIEHESDNIPGWLVKTVEREWASDFGYLPLHIALGDRKQFVSQIRKRLTLNPIWATVHMGGSFDARTRFFYQLGSVLSRIPASIRRISGTVSHRS